MPYEPFGGTPSVNTVKNPLDEKFFAQAKEQLGFSLDVDLVTFCGAIGFYMTALKKKTTKANSPNLKKLVNMQTFGARYMYDYIIRNFLDITNPTIKDFDEYFYTGFSILMDWFKKNGENMEGTLHTYTELINDLLEDEDKIK